MKYRNGTYVAFDGQGTTNPTQSDLKYLGLLRSWNNNNTEFHFSDSHLKTYQVLDSSKMSTLKNRLNERLSLSKNMLLILSSDTNYNRGLLNWEIERAIEIYNLPIIIAYPGYNYIMDPSALSSRWPKMLYEKINNSTVNAIHIPFRQTAIMTAINQFSIHSTGNNILTSPLSYYNEQTYRNWGYMD